MKIFLRVRLISLLFKFIRHPEQTNIVFDIADILRRLGSVRLVKERLHREPDSSRLLKERKLLVKVDLDQLLKLAPGSLGYAFASHMRANNLDPDFFRNLEIADDEAYILMRMRQAHDLWHVVTGFGTDVAGEFALLSIMLSYVKLPLPALLVGGGLMRAAMKDPKMIEVYANALDQGCALGSRTEGLFAYDWESNWTKPLADVRRELNLEVKSMGRA